MKKKPINAVIYEKARKRLKNPPLHESITNDRVINAITADDNIGFCIYCGADQSGVEPDAENYNCESCNQPGVCGAENLFIRYF